MQAPHTLATPPRKKNWLGPSMLIVGIAEGVNRPMGNKARAPSGPRGKTQAYDISIPILGSSRATRLHQVCIKGCFVKFSSPPCGGLGMAQPSHEKLRFF